MRISKSYTHGLIEVYFTNHRVLHNLSTIHHYLRNDQSNLPLYIIMIETRSAIKMELLRHHPTNTTSGSAQHFIVRYYTYCGQTASAEEETRTPLMIMMMRKECTNLKAIPSHLLPPFPVHYFRINCPRWWWFFFFLLFAREL